jgi:hypothetical protein
VSCTVWKNELFAGVIFCRFPAGSQFHEKWQKCSFWWAFFDIIELVNTATHTGKWSVARNVFVVALSVVIVTMLFRLTEAGSLNPAAAPASSSESFENLYQAMTGTFDSSGITGDKNGSALQISKCIIAKMTGGTPCP